MTARRKLSVLALSVAGSWAAIGLVAGLVILVLR